MATTLTLSTIQPDWPDLSLSLETALAQTQTWPPLLPTQTASIVTEGVTTMGAFLATGIQNVFEEAYPQTARMNSSLLAGARFNGVRLQRKTPAGTPVTITNSGSTSVTIAPYQTFSSSAASLFNRSALLVPANSSINATFYEGFITQVQYLGQGISTGQIISVPVPGFTISDTDVVVTLNSVPLTIITDGIWHYPVSSNGTPNLVVQDATLPTGELILEFGNSQFGVIPANGSTILVTFAVTNGTSGNNSGFTNTKITYAANSAITAVATGALAGGLDQPTAESYRQSPLIYSSYQRAVAIPDHPAIATLYPGVVDAIFLGQKDIAPNLVQWMNVVYCYLLMNTGNQMDSTTFNTGFLPWFQNRAMPLNYVLESATAITVNVTGTIYIFGTGDPTTVQTEATTAVQKLLAANRGVLGRNLMLDDIRNAMRTSDPNIDYVEVTTPTTDTICKILPPSAPSVVQTTNGSGSMVAGTYNYAISAVGPQGETFASPTTTLILGAPNNAALITWPAILGTTSYNIYGRSTSNLFLLGNVAAIAGQTPSTTYSFTDLGTVSSGAAVNQINQSGLSYVTPGTVTIDVQFTKRTGGQTLGVTT